MNYCTSCGRKLEGWEAVCPDCGKRLQTPKSAENQGVIQRSLAVPSSQQKSHPAQQQQEPALERKQHTAQKATDEPQAPQAPIRTQKQKISETLRIVAASVLWCVALGLIAYLAFTPYWDTVIVKYTSVFRIWWYLALLAADIALLIWCAVGLIRTLTKHKQAVLSVVTLFLAVILLAVAALGGYLINSEMTHRRDLLSPWYCLMYSLHDEENARTILEELEDYGLYDPDFDYRAQLRDSLFYPQLHLQNTRGEYLTSFILFGDSVHWNTDAQVYIYPESASIFLNMEYQNYESDCNVIVEDGHVRDVIFMIDGAEYYFVKDGVQIEDPLGCYTFASMMNSNYEGLGYAPYNRLDLVSTLAAEDLGISRDQLEFKWGAMKQLRADHPWALKIKGTVRTDHSSVNWSEKEIVVYFQAATDEEIDAFHTDEGNPYHVTYEILE